MSARGRWVFLRRLRRWIRRLSSVICPNPRTAQLGFKHAKPNLSTLTFSEKLELEGEAGSRHRP